MRKTVPVGELDRPSTDTPFKFQGFVLENPQQIEILQQHCKRVLVDPDRSEVPAKLPDSPRLRSAVDLSRTKVATQFQAFRAKIARCTRARRAS